MSVFICPVCAERLDISGKSYVCCNRHSFDIARSGYVNLLLSKHIGKAVHGDNKLMLRARRDFLEAGYYSPLCEKVAEITVKFAKNGSVVLDAGCGEGYYSVAINDYLCQQNIATEMYGIDISKDAVEMAAKRKSGITFAAASVFHLPVVTKSCDILLTMFAPYCGEEYRRVLNDRGIMIMVIPSENHLWELKSAIYDVPYKNNVNPYELDGFEFLGSERVTFCMKITEKSSISDLFSMTPYYYRTGKVEQERLNALETLETQADFEILVYRKD